MAKADIESAFRLLPVWRFQTSAVFSFPGDVAGNFDTLLKRF
jgi:hypothetical protein